MNAEHERARPSPPAAAAIAAWMVAVCFMQWLLYGPPVDLHTLTWLPLGFLQETWLPLLRDLMTAPLGK